MVDVAGEAKEKMEGAVVVVVVGVAVNCAVVKENGVWDWLGWLGLGWLRLG